MNGQGFLDIGKDISDPDKTKRVSCKFQDSRSDGRRVILRRKEQRDRGSVPIAFQNRMPFKHAK